MAAGRKLDITIAEAQLVRIFDSLKPNQDVFVQLVCCYADGDEKVVGRTETCKNGNFHPRWNERFLCGRDSDRGSKTLKFRVNIDHLWRNPVLCGEAEFSLDNLWSRASGGPQKVPVPLFKRGEQTGMLSITIALDSAGKSFSGPAALSGYPVPVRDAAAASADARLPTPHSAASGNSGATPAATPGGTSNGTPFYTPAGTPYAGTPYAGTPYAGTPFGTPAGEGGLRLAPTRSPQGAQRYEFIPQAADGHSPAQAAPFQQPSPQMPQMQATPQAAPYVPQQLPQQLGQAAGDMQVFLQPPSAQPPTAQWPAPPPQSSVPAPAPLRAEPPMATLAVPAAAGPCQVDPGREAGSQVRSPGGSVYATGASGQWWNSFIDRG